MAKRRGYTRIKLGKNLSIGRTGLRIGGRIGNKGPYVSTGASGTYMGLSAGPIRHSSFFPTPGRPSTRKKRKMRASATTPAPARNGSTTARELPKMTLSWGERLAFGGVALLALMAGGTAGSVSVTFGLGILGFLGLSHLFTRRTSSSPAGQQATNAPVARVVPTPPVAAQNPQMMTATQAVLAAQSPAAVPDQTVSSTAVVDGDHEFAPPTGGVDLADSDAYELEGEHHYPDGLRRALRGRDPRSGISETAYLVHQPRNRHDRNAVVVNMKGPRGGLNPVGFIPGADAPRWIAAVERLEADGREASCPATIYGTADDPQVRLDIAGPEEL